MDRKLVKALKLVPECRDSLEDVRTAVVAASKAAASAFTFHAEGEIDLSNARICRAEKLLVSLRESLRIFDPQLKAFLQELKAVTQLPIRRKAAWNALPDQWWQERATNMIEKLSAVQTSREVIGHSLDVASLGDDPVVRTYYQLVEDVRDSVRYLNECWSKVEQYIEEWRDLAEVLVEGIGESGSLIPP